ncbi:Fic family protein [Geitlerinema sp. PCC 7407]|uniref:Fic family protein n=1 Tax=Geitlerinema sp. PCC 7407 TaxID=1173025 RepID=UPI00029FA98F|nr:Fic family protein [Geitlerinema sp. PCC 7407]AFY67933.1 filamentation induced by cAMP protein Fic [Geitlerinema sp. PCC 7407]
MNREDFENSPVGKLVLIEQGDSPCYAFVPNPLPPNTQLDNIIWRSLSEADRALGELAGLGRTMPNPNLLIRPFIRREAVLSSKIEGTQTEIANLYAYENGQLSLPGLSPQPPEADMQEVLNYVNALEYGIERLATLPICKRFLCELHEKLLKGVRGENRAPGQFRQSQNWIGSSSACIQDARFVPPPVPDMSACLNAFETYVNGKCDFPPLIRIGLIHYQFESIHPFSDGNGRIGRLLISLLLLNWNLLPIPLLYLSAFFERNRRQYYDLMLDVSKKGNWSDWLSFFLQGVTEQSRDALIRAKKLQDLQIEWRDRLSQARTSALLPRLSDSLFESPLITIPQAQKLLEVTYKSAQLNVEKLVQAGILEQIDDFSYNRVFVAPEILRIVGE